ncbi:hypothetical protein ACQJBY_037097 [Aegilops geniculata]
MQRWVRGVAALVGQARNGAVAAAVSDALHWRQSGTVTWPRTRAAFRVVERLRTARISQLASSSVQMLISNFRSTRLVRSAIFFLHTCLEVVTKSFVACLTQLFVFT